jgi:hypothetical protein
MSDIDDIANIYSKDRQGRYQHQVHPDDIRTVDTITRPSKWGFDVFKTTMIALATIGKYTPYYIPSKNVPESIHFGNLRKYIDEMNTLIGQTGNEHIRMFLVDPNKHELVVGKRVGGDRTSTHQDWTFPVGRFGLRKAFTIHCHPTLDKMAVLSGRQETAHGLSGEDYKTFIGDTEQLAMLMTWGDNTMLVVKNTTTPNIINPTDVNRRVDALEKEFLNGRLTLDKVVDFNKTACLEFGLNLFIANKGTDLATRRSVV